MCCVPNKKELEAILAKCMQSGELRAILAKQGIPTDQPVKLSIKFYDTQLITAYEIPIISPPVAVDPTETNFDQEMKDFLNKCQDDYGLLNAMYPNAEDGTQIKCYYIFDIPSTNEKLEHNSGFKCCPPRIP